MTRVYKSWSNGLAASPGATEYWASNRPSDNISFPRRFLRLNHGPGIGCQLLYSCGSDAVGRWLVMVAPAQTWNPLRPIDPFSATIRQSIRLVSSFSGPFCCPHGAPVLGACWRLPALHSTPGFPFCLISLCLTIAPLRLSNVGYS